MSRRARPAAGTRVMTHCVISLMLAATALLGACGQRAPGAAIWGHAVLRGYDDHSGIEIRLSDSDRIAVTDRYGYFALPQVPAGRYVVTASRTGTHERRVSTVVEHDGVHPTGAHLTLSPFGRIEGHVTDPDGGPIQFATVQVLGTDVSATSAEAGAFVIDPAPAGNVVLSATYTDFEAGETEVRVPVGSAVQADVRLGPDAGPGLYDVNRPPHLGAITLEARADLSYPRVVPLVDTSGDVVRRGGAYELRVHATDPDGDPITVYWSADRGTLESATGEDLGNHDYGALWRAGGGISTLTCTAIDPLGGSATARLVVEAAGDNIRSGGRFGDTIYYSERRGDDFDVYAYDLSTGAERPVHTGNLEQHATLVTGDWLVYGDSEFVFIGTLVYRMRAENLVTGDQFTFGQPFDHDSYFVMRLDLYTPLTGPWVPYASSDDNLAPVGFGYLDLVGDDPVTVPAFSTAGGGPANLRSYARSGDRDVWLAGDGHLWTQVGNSGPIDVASVGTDTLSPYDVQLHDDVAAFLPSTDGPLYWIDLSRSDGLHTAGTTVTSFAVYGRHLSWAEQGPTSASVELLDLDTGVRRTLTTTPHFARRVWFMDDQVVIWGDQGSEGQAFVALNTELLWVARIDDGP